MNRTYECMCLLDNREVRKGWEPLKESVAGLFTKHDAKVLSNRRWDERRLAYSINGQNRATYLLIYFSVDTESIPALRRELEFSEPMLRYMIVDCPEIPAEASEPEAEFDVNAIPEDDQPDVPAVEEKAEEKPEEKTEAKAEGEASAESTDGGEAKAEGAGDEAPKAEAESTETPKEDN